MEKIKERIQKIQELYQEKTLSGDIVEEVFNEMETLIKDLYQGEETKRENFLRDLVNFNKNRPQMISRESKLLDDYSRTLTYFEDLLISILNDFELSQFIEYHKKHKDIDESLLLCYEAIFKLCEFYFLLLSSVRFIHRNEVEKIVKILKHNEILLIEKLDLNVKIISKESEILIEEKIGEYEFHLNDLVIQVFMKIDSILGVRIIYEGYSVYMRTQIVSFLESIRNKLLTHRLQSFILKRKEVEIFLDKASEDDFTNLFIVPIFKKMGFKQIISKGHIERSNEFGQDIKLMKLQLPSKHYLYFVAQIKTGAIGASSKQPTKEIEGILTEIRPAFNKNIFDPEINRRVKPDHVYLIVSGRIGEQAQNYLHEQIDTDLKRNLLILDRRQLIDLFFDKGIEIDDQEEIKDYLVKLVEND